MITNRIRRYAIQRFLLTAMAAVILLAVSPKPAHSTWLFSYPPNMVTLTSGHRNNIFYVGQAVSFSMMPSNYGTYTATGLVTYEVRDYYGNVVDTGTTLAPTATTTSTITSVVTQPGWYKLNINGPTSYSPWGTSVGSTTFCIFRNNPNFPTEPSINLPNNSGAYDGDPVARGVTGMGPQRHPVTNVADPNGAIANLTTSIGLDEQYYTPFDLQRTRPLLIEFPNGVGSSNPATLATNLAGLKAIVQQFHNQVKYWEPLNEPNGEYTGAQYVQNELIPFYNTVKSVDPTCKVVGPAVVTIGPYGLNWLNGFFAAGGGNYIDAFSFHAYNNILGDLTLANESFAGLNSLLAQYGLQNIEKWQTEQGYFAACYGAFEPRLQGRWTMLQMMSFEQNGIPKEHNVLWYDVANGFWDEPAFFEQADGQYSYGGFEPSAALMRVWSEELYGTTFSQAYNFGVTGNKLLIGSLFNGPGKQVAVFMGNGRTDGQVNLNVSSGSTLNVVSAFGITSSIQVSNGVAVLPVPEMPVYVELQSGQTISVVPINLGQDLALQSGVTATASGNGLSPINSSYPNPISKIYNGVLENWYYNQGNGDFPWMDDTATFPAWVQINLPTPQPVSHVIIYSGVPWQQGGSLLDYDLQYLQNGNWVTLSHTVEPTPTEDFFTPPVFSTVDSYYSDRSIFEHDFPAVTTSAIRIYVNNTTYGGAATADVVAAGGQPGPHNITLREVEIYGPNGGSLPPSPPTGLTPTAGNAAVALTWSAVTGATSYNIKRSNVTGGPYTTLSNPSAPNYTDSQVTNGNTYYYVVSAVDAGGESANSSEVSATPTLPQIAPSTPTGLNATAGNALVSLVWSPVVGAATYNVKRLNANGAYATISSPTSAFYIDTNLTNGTLYKYVISAVNAAGESANSNPATATPQAPVPSTPTGLTAVSGDGLVALNWNAVSGATSYNLKSSTTNGGPYTTVLSPNTNAVSDGGLTNGTTYYFVVSAVGPGGESNNSSQSSAVPNPPLPQPPTTLKASPGNGFVTLTWSSSVNATSYNVYRSPTLNGPYTAITNTAQTSFTDSSVTNGVTYYYTVSSVGARGESQFATAVAATPTGPLPSIVLTASPLNVGVLLSWTPVPGTQFYDVQRSYTNGGPYRSVANIWGGVVYQDPNVVNGTNYYYIVIAHLNTGGLSAASNQACTMPDPPGQLNPPTGLTATAGNATVQLSWTPETGVTGYNVDRSITNGGPYITIGGTNNSSYTDNSVSNGVTYYYVVTALGVSGQSPNSGQVSATPSAPLAPPVPPNGLNATPGNALVSLAWSPVIGASSYNVKRSTSSGGPYMTVASPNSNLYTDSPLVDGTNYYYVVSAVGAGGESVNSGQASATPSAPLAPPVPPNGLNATPGNALVLVAWTPVTGASSYNLKRSTSNGGPYTTVASPSSISYSDSPLANGTSYYYVVSAVGSGGESANSGQASATPVAPLMPPVPPTGLTSTGGNALVTLGWIPVAGASSYNIKRSTSSGGPYITVSSTSTNAYTDSSVSNGTTYYYVVSAVGPGGESTNSGQVAATPKAPVLVGSIVLNATAQNVGVSLSWTTSPGTQYYSVQRALVSGGPYQQVATCWGGTAFSDPNVNNGRTYYYVVVAYTNNGPSAPSNEASATPSGGG